MRSLTLPCEDGTLHVRIVGAAARHEDDFAAMISACACHLDRSTHGLAARIQRNVRAHPDSDSVRVYLRKEEPPVTCTEGRG